MRLSVSFLLFFLFTVSMPLTAAPRDEIASGDGIADRLRTGAVVLAQGVQRPMAGEEELAGEMVLIPGGVFRMGDLSGEGGANERPAHDVTVPAFWLGKYEVTFTQWDACLADGGCRGYRPHDVWGAASGR